MIAIETVNYSLKSGTDEASFRSALQQTNQWLTTQKGFVRLQHGADEKGGRIDIVEWKSMDDAMAIANSFMDAEENRAYLGAIEPGSVTIRHFQT